MKKEYVLKFCHPQITIQEDAKEDFKKLMEWDEQKFMSMVFVRLKGKRTNGEIINSINSLLGFKKYEEKVKWSNANKQEMLRLEKAIKKILDASKGVEE